MAPYEKAFVDGNSRLFLDRANVFLARGKKIVGCYGMRRFVIYIQFVVACMDLWLCKYVKHLFKMPEPSNCRSLCNCRFIDLEKSMQSYLRTSFPKPKTMAWPLSNEPHISCWGSYAQQASVHGAYLVLKKHHYCFRFPIEAGVSQTDMYQAARLRGLQPLIINEGISLKSPDSLTLQVVQSVAGSIPVISTSNRTDFTRMVQAFAFKNEPTPIPNSMGACMIAGYNNWNRIHTYKKKWIVDNPNHCSETAWQTEFNRLVSQKLLYQDRFIILHDGPYSGVSAEEMGLNAEEWRALSLKIRLTHECTHYFTKRVFGVMRRHVFDELLADYAGLVAAMGCFRADWFLLFMGMEDYPVYREGGRLQNYLDNISLDSYEFQMVQTMLKAAAENLQRFDYQLGPEHRELAGQAMVLLAICHFSLMQLAEETAPAQLRERLQLVEIDFREGG